MCNYKVLHNNQNGYVILCCECSHIQLAFGNISLALTEKQFQSFQETVYEQNRIYFSEPFRDQKVIHLPTCAKSITMVFSPDELEALTEILGHAQHSLGILNLLVLDEK